MPQMSGIVGPLGEDDDLVVLPLLPRGEASEAAGRWGAKPLTARERTCHKVPRTELHKLRRNDVNRIKRMTKACYASGSAVLF